VESLRDDGGSKRVLKGGAKPSYQETEYNGGLCQTTFATLMRQGVFGSPRDIPPQILNDGIDFEYESPLHDAIEEQKGQMFLETKALIAEALDIDQGAAYVMDSRTALRDALTGVGVPATWLNSEDDVDEMVANAADQQQQAMDMERALQGSEVAKNTAAAGQQLEMV
jgi:hypothetical protein